MAVSGFETIVSGLGKHVAMPQKAISRLFSFGFCFRFVLKRKATIGPKRERNEMRTRRNERKMKRNHCFRTGKTCCDAPEGYFGIRIASFGFQGLKQPLCVSPKPNMENLYDRKAKRSIENGAETKHLVSIPTQLLRKTMAGQTPHPDLSISPLLNHINKTLEWSSPKFLPTPVIVRQRPSTDVQTSADVDRRDSLRRSSVKIGTIQRSSAWPLRKDDAHKTRSVNRRTSTDVDRHQCTSTKNSRIFFERKF